LTQGACFPEDVLALQGAVTHGEVVVHVHHVTELPVLDDPLAFVVVSVARNGSAVVGAGDPVLVVPGDISIQAACGVHLCEHVSVQVVSKSLRPSLGHRVRPK